MIDAKTLEDKVQILERRLNRLDKELTSLKYFLEQASSIFIPDEDCEAYVDPVFNQAVELFSKYEKASSSLIQRKLSVGYARAARILDQLYEAGLVGPDNGAKPREVHSDKIAAFLTEANNQGQK